MNKDPKLTSRSVGRALGYSDDDLATPGHDALVLWIRKNMYRVLEGTILENLQGRYVREHSRLQELEDGQLRKRFGEAVGDRKSRRVELPEGTPWFSYYKPELEKRVQGGWIDVYSCGEVYVEADYSRSDRIELKPARWHLAIEVKTSIRSFGELLRQLRVYESALGDLTKFRPNSSVNHGPTYVYVASPDDRFADDLRDQGFGFCKLDVPAVEGGIESGAPR
ncbi:MAG: hypothetical protein JWO52_4075 [Gammaproteobacteria bacterium]|nr:hypothetical protein [Gammaproteobacteria bacterium]